MILFKSVQHTLLKSLALNGVAYLGILVILETFYNTPDHHLFGYSYTDLTGYPLYLICLLFNSKLYAKIAQSHQQGIQQRDDSNIDIVSSINTIILYGSFALFIAVLRRVSYIGSILSFFIYCIIMSYYCFEYKWINEDWSIEQRMIYAEEHWAYCLGFGLPATTITFFLSTLRAGGVFALVYPSFIMMASVATPEPRSTLPRDIPFSDSGLPFRIPVFFGVRLVNECIVKTIRTVGGSRGASFVTEKKKDNLGKLV
ncbi:unnamed protein product [Mucor hiemalis]